MITYAVVTAILCALCLALAFYHGLDEVHFGWLLASYALGLLTFGLLIVAAVRWVLIGTGLWQA